MKRDLILVAILTLILFTGVSIGLFGVYSLYLQASSNVQNVQVTISQNLEDNGWYWTQFNLPEGGELLEKVNYDEYARWNNISDTMANYRISVHGIFYGTFCCAQTIPGKYVFLPTDDLNAGVDTLVYFGKDGSIWVINVPDSLLTPADGEVITTAIVYR